ncbi:RNA polymerase sigma factor [Kiloniella majae]|uniref:RNA polymerase sigma factor n=1 Tax=Kiloniella majae TaxID=1938558 RepID=UPI000A278460|nr:RNA polymerase sigma factor [Kiloniella majae]
MLRSFFGSRRRIEKLVPDLKAYAIALCGDREQAEDLVQEAIARAFESGSRLKSVDELRPWLFRVLRNHFFDEQRKKTVRREYFAQEKRWVSEINDQALAPEDTLAIRKAYEELSADHREVLALVDILGLRYKEVAELLDISPGTVMSRISRARQALLQRLEEEADEKIVKFPHESR